MIDQINELPEDGLKSSPETSRFTENKWISRKNQNKLYFLHLIDILKVCRKSICNLCMIVSEYYDFEMEKRHGIILSNILSKNSLVRI